MSRTFLEEHPDTIRDLISGLGDAIDVANDDAAAAQATVNDGIEAITTKRLGDTVISGAWENLEFTLDPIASSLQGSADDAIAVGLLDPVDLADPGIYDLTLLNEVLAERGEAEVDRVVSGPVIRLRDVDKTFGSGHQRVHRAPRRRPRGRPGRVRLPDRGVGMRQVDHPQPRRRAGVPERRHRRRARVVPP